MDIVILLIVLTCISSFYAWSNAGLMESWIMSPYIVHRRGEWYRFLTSGFLHADVAHLAFNMFAFFSFSAAARYYFEASFGETTALFLFLLLYLGGIIVSDIPTYFKHRRDSDYRSLGASGGVASVMFSCILFEPLGGIGLIFLPNVSIPSFVFGFLYLGYSYYQSKRMGDNVNHDAHFYGALYGVLLTLVLKPDAGLSFWEQIIDKYL